MKKLLHKNSNNVHNIININSSNDVSGIWLAF